VTDPQPRLTAREERVRALNEEIRAAEGSHTHTHYLGLNPRTAGLRGMIELLEVPPGSCAFANGHCAHRRVETVETYRGALTTTATAYCCLCDETRTETHR